MTALKRRIAFPPVLPAQALCWVCNHTCTVVVVHVHAGIAAHPLLDHTVSPAAADHTAQLAAYCEAECSADD